jgi:hypothetical protein
MGYDHRRYRSQLKKDAKERSKGRGRGKGRWNFFKLQEKSTFVRLIPGNHMCFDGIERPFFVKRTHYDVMGKKTRDCMGAECLPCHDRERKERKGGKKAKQRFNPPTSKYVYTEVHLGKYHKVEKDRDDGDGTFTVYDVCKGRRCEMCRDEVETSFGRKLHWTLNESDHGTLESYDDTLATQCLCGEGEIDYKAYRCTGCDRTLRDAEDFEGSDIEFIKLGFEDFHCSKCGVEDLPVPEIECVKEDGDGEWDVCCDDPRPAHIFAVDLEVKGVQKTGRGDVSWLGLQIVGHRICDIDERVAEFAEPFDFDVMFDMTLERQADILDMEIPPGMGKKGRNAPDPDDDGDKDKDKDEEYEEDVEYEDD